MTRSVEILDTTLRDGAQAEGISFTVEDKLSIINILSSLGIHIIECGNPYSNPKDRELFERLEDVHCSSSLAAFGSTRKKYSSAEEDKAVNALLTSGCRAVCVVGKTSLSQVRTVLETDGEENLRMIYDSLSLLKERGHKVYFDCEHFFDGYKEDRIYSMKALECAVSAGADLRHKRLITDKRSL